MRQPELLRTFILCKNVTLFSVPSGEKAKLWGTFSKQIIKGALQGRRLTFEYSKLSIYIHRNNTAHFLSIALHEKQGRS